MNEPKTGGSEVNVLSTRLRHIVRGVVVALSGGVLIQLSCNTIAAEAVAGVFSAFVNEYIRQVISKWLGISTGYIF